MTRRPEADQSVVTRLLWDADTKLASFFSEQEKENEARSLVLLADRNINLKSYTDSLLDRDRHFQEMLRDIDRYGNGNVTAQSTRDAKRSFALYALLRSILRECIALPDVFERKVNIERIYNWYREKRKRMLEIRSTQQQDFQSSGMMAFTVKKLASRPQKSPPKSHLHIASASPQRSQQDVAEVTPRAADADSFAMSPISTLSAASPGNVTIPRLTRMRLEHEAQNQASNFATARDEEEEDDYMISNDFAADTQRSAISRATTQLTDRSDFGQLSVRRRSVASNIPQLTSRSEAAFKRPSTSPTGITSRSVMSVGAVPPIASSSSSAFAHAPSSASSDAEREMQTLWLTRRAAETQAKLEEKEFTQVVQAWASNRSRIEEEMTRRAESLAGGRMQLALQRIHEAQSAMGGDEELRPRGYQSPHWRTRRLAAFPGIELPAEPEPAPPAGSGKDDADGGSGKKGKGDKGKKGKGDKDKGGKGKKEKGKKDSGSSAPTPVPPEPSVFYIQPPSEFRLKQLEECDRIRAALARRNVPVPSAVLERGLLLPEDRGHDTCVKRLPLPGAGLFVNPFGESKKGKKGKGKKGKSGGKKKKK